MFRNLLFFNLFLFSFTWSSYSDASRVCSTESSCFQPEIIWNFDNQGRISNVCHNYPYGHWKYRQCRMSAQQEFKNRCARYKADEKNTQGKLREQARANQRVYCIAFRP